MKGSNITVLLATENNRLSSKAYGALRADLHSGYADNVPSHANLPKSNYNMALYNCQDHTQAVLRQVGLAAPFMTTRAWVLVFVGLLGMVAIVGAAARAMLVTPDLPIPPGSRGSLRKKRYN